MKAMQNNFNIPVSAGAGYRGAPGSFAKSAIKNNQQSHQNYNSKPDNSSAISSMQMGHNSGPTHLSCDLKSRNLGRNVVSSNTDSIQYYAEAIKNNSITAEEYGKYMNIYSDYVLTYPDLINYDEETQARVIASFPKTLGLIDVDKELPYKKMNDFVKNYFGPTNYDYNEILKKYKKDGIITQAQERYIREAITIVMQDPSSSCDKSVSTKLDRLIDRVQGDWSLNKQQRDMLVIAFNNTKYDAVANGRINTGGTSRKTASTEIIYTDGKTINCSDCFWKNRHKIAAVQAASVLLFAALIVGMIAAMAALSSIGPEILVVLAALGLVSAFTVSVSVLNNIQKYGVYKYYCGEFCADHRDGIMTCDACPWYNLFFDGANCYLGWYGSTVPGWVYGSSKAPGFWYRGNVSGCNDGFLNSSWAYVPFDKGGHGVPTGGGDCLFGYNYDPSYKPWVGSSGFYLKPNCRGVF